MSQVTRSPASPPAIARVLNEKTFLGAFNVLNQETVGPQVGKELQRKAIWAVILSTLAMGVYLWLRFDLMFGAAAVVCIIHDVCIVAGLPAMINGEFSLNIVAALLLIVGYSINDTVVMYDRVRENRRKIKTRMTLDEQLNLAMNQTLSRTILTSGSVVIVLIALILFGGKVIHEIRLDPAHRRRRRNLLDDDDRPGRGRRLEQLRPAGRRRGPPAGRSRTKPSAQRGAPAPHREADGNLANACIVPQTRRLPGRAVRSGRAVARGYFLRSRNDHAIDCRLSAFDRLRRHTEQKLWPTTSATKPSSTTPSGRPGKTEVVPTKPTATQRDLSLAYTPGVADSLSRDRARPGGRLQVHEQGQPRRRHLNGTAVLGLGDIGPAGRQAGHGRKGVLFKRFADIDVFDLESTRRTPRSSSLR